jgi:hypothetical protein
MPGQAHKYDNLILQFYCNNRGDTSYRAAITFIFLIPTFVPRWDCLQIL